MRPFTMNIDDGLLRAAKIHALNTGRSMSDIVRDLLAREIGWSNEAPPCFNDAAALPVLQAYSERRMSRRQAMQALNLAPERQPDFVEAMNRLSIPWPEPDPAQIDREAEIVLSAIRESNTEG